MFQYNDEVSTQSFNFEVLNNESLVSEGKEESNILENNIVQTAASAGESLAAGVIFTIPALLLIGYWDDFNYLEIARIAAIGGIIGVLFTIPLRRALILEAKLRFPEGIATAEVLKAGEKATYVMTFYLDPEMVNDPTVQNLEDVTMSYTFFSTDYYKQS